VELPLTPEPELPQVQAVAPVVVPEAPVKPPSKRAAAKSTESAAKKEPRKKAEKTVRARPAPKVVSNVATTSLADIYLRQGHKEQALVIYRKILKQDPMNKVLQEKVRRLDDAIEESQDN